MVAALAGAVVGAAVGAFATYLGAVRVARLERDARREDEERARTIKRSDMRAALEAALDRNVEIIDALRPEIRSKGLYTTPPPPDLALLDATAETKFGLLEIPTCAEIDRARDRLVALRRALDYVAAMYVAGVGAAKATDTGSTDLRIDYNRRDVERLRGEARAACDVALVKLRGRGAVPEPPAEKPAAATK